MPSLCSGSSSGCALLAEAELDEEGNPVFNGSGKQIFKELSEENRRIAAEELLADLAENISSARIPKVLLHEVSGHLGLRKLFSGEFDRFLFSIAQTHSDEVAKIAADRNLDISNEAGLLEAAEEFVATFAENGTENTIWQRIAAAFRNFLRNLGFDLEYSDSELRSLLSRGLRNLQGSAVKDNLTTDGGVRYLAEPFTEAQKSEILAMVTKNGVDVVKKILYGGSITRNGNTVHFDGKNSHALKLHLDAEGFKPSKGPVTPEEVEEYLPLALAQTPYVETKNNRRGKKQRNKIYKITENGIRYTLVTASRGEFRSFYSNKKVNKRRKFAQQGASATGMLTNDNISQNPENANPKKSGSARHSVANDGGFRSSDPHKEELWAKFIVKIANANYINTDAAAALLLDHGVRITPQDEQTLVAACVIARDMVRQRNARMRKSADVKAARDQRRTASRDGDGVRFLAFDKDGNQLFNVQGRGQMTITDIINDKNISEDTEILTDSGSNIWGKITDEMAKKGEIFGLAPLPIKLFKGNHGFGIVHIYKHLSDFPNQDLARLMSLVFGNIEKMYARNDAGKIKLEIFPPKARYYGILELRKQDGYYSIVSFFTRKKEHEKPKGKLIWVRSSQSATSQATSDQPKNEISGEMLQENQAELTAQTSNNINPLQREIKLVSEKKTKK